MQHGAAGAEIKNNPGKMGRGSSVVPCSASLGARRGLPSESARFHADRSFTIYRGDHKSHTAIIRRCLIDASEIRKVITTVNVVAEKRVFSPNTPIVIGQINRIIEVAACKSWKWVGS